MTKSAKTIRKIVLIVISVIAALIIVCGLTALILFKSYLNKIDYDHQESLCIEEQNDYIVNDEEIIKELLKDEPVIDEKDSPEKEINELESQMKEQVQQMQNEDRNPNDVFNILLVGCDSREKNGRGRSDAMILVSVNENTQKIHLTSIMRDSYVVIPGKGNNRINAAYAFGGGSLLLETIETNLAVDVDRYVALDFYAFIDIVDSIGGIDIEVTEEEIPILNKYVKELNKLNGREKDTDLLTESGLQHLNGTQTLGYTRIRYVGNGDFERTKRQRTVISKVFEKAKTLSLLEINDLLNVLLPEIKTNLTEGEILLLLFDAVTYLTYELDSMRIPIDNSYQSMRVNGMSVLGVDLEKNQKALRDFIEK